MSRTMITRTIESTEVTALCLNVVTAEPSDKTFVLAGTYKTDEKLLNALRKAYETDEDKIVHIVDKKVINTLYGLDENIFLQYAVKLNPETRKPFEDATEK